MNAKELFQAGRLNDSLQAALDHVKAKPTDRGQRFFLAELSCFAGDWDRADRQLESVIQQSPDGAMLSMLVRQLIRAELLREQVFMEGRPPELVVPLTRTAEIGLQICTELRLGHRDQASQLVGEAESLRTDMPGECNGKPFKTLRDLDDRVADVLEVLTTTGKYFWVPWTNIIALEFEAPQRPMDLLWRKVQIEVRDGPEGEVYIPARYPSKFAELDDSLRLGRSTDWLGEDGEAVIGQGLRMLLVDENPINLMELKSLRVVQPESEETPDE